MTHAFAKHRKLDELLEAAMDRDDDKPRGAASNPRGLDPDDFARDQHIARARAGDARYRQVEGGTSDLFSGEWTGAGSVRCLITLYGL